MNTYLCVAVVFLLLTLSVIVWTISRLLIRLEKLETIVFELNSENTYEIIESEEIK